VGGEHEVAEVGGVLEDLAAGGVVAHLLAAGARPVDVAAETARLDGLRGEVEDVVAVVVAVDADGAEALAEGGVLPAGKVDLHGVCIGLSFGGRRL